MSGLTEIGENDRKVPVVDRPVGLPDGTKWSGEFVGSYATLRARELQQRHLGRQIRLYPPSASSGFWMTLNYAVLTETAVELSVVDPSDGNRSYYLDPGAHVDVEVRATPPEGRYGVSGYYAAGVLVLDVDVVAENYEGPNEEEIEASLREVVDGSGYEEELPPPTIVRSAMPHPYLIRIANDSVQVMELTDE